MANPHIDLSEWRKAMTDALKNAHNASSAFLDAIKEQEAAKLRAWQQARKEHWDKGKHEPFEFKDHPHTRKFEPGGEWDSYMYNQYVNGGTFTREGESKYTFSFNVDNETYERMTNEPAEKMLIPIPGLPNWWAPHDYNAYSTGPMAGSHTIIKKDMQVNPNVFQTIPFTHIPSELIID
jgi:hypothetical protein